MARKHGFFRPHVAGLSGIYSTTLREGVGGDPITRLFASGANGLLVSGTALYQLSAGVTTVADDAAEPIGRASDRHSWAGRTLEQELARQSELAANGYTLSNGAGTGSATEGPDGTYSLIGDGTNGATAKKSFTTVVGAAYRLTLTVGNSAVGLLIGTTTGSSDILSAVPDVGAQTIIFVATTATTHFTFYKNGATLTTVSGISCKLLSGNHALQATTGSRPSLEFVDDYPVVRFGVAASLHSLLTPRIPASTGFMMFHGTLTGGTGVRIAMGAVTSGTDRIYLGFDNSNKALCRVGDGAQLGYAAGSDLLDTRCTVAVRWNGTTVDLFENGVLALTQAQVGAPTTTTPLRLGAYNSAGTASSFFTGDGYDFLQADTYPSEADIAAYHAFFLT